MKKLNLGCGILYEEGWVNLDFNKEVRADVYADLEKPLPFKDNTFDYIFAGNVLEHIEHFYQLMEELYRITKPGGTIEVWTPHYTGQYAFKYLDHKKFFGVGSMDMFTDDTPSKQRYCKAKFIVKEEKLSFFLHKYWAKDGFTGKILMFINHFNFLFNFSRMWRLFCERFWLFGFDEIKYVLEVRK